jgi:hypothetical protein
MSQDTDKPEKRRLGERIRESNFGKFVRDRVKPVAGDILEVVGDVTGIQAIETVGALINGRKDQNDEYKKLWLDFERYRLEWTLEMHKIDIQAELDSYKSEVEDRVSARIREADFVKATGKRDWLMGAVVITGLVLLVGTVLSLIFITIPTENQRLADMCFGAIMSIGASIFSYYVGSSRGSMVKDQTIQALSGGE